MENLIQRKRGQDVKSEVLCLLKNHTNSNSVNWLCVVENCNWSATTRIKYRSNINTFAINNRHIYIADWEYVFKTIKIYVMKQLVALYFKSSRDIVNAILKSCNEQTIRMLEYLKTCKQSYGSIVQTETSETLCVSHTYINFSIISHPLRQYFWKFAVYFNNLERHGKF